MHTKGIRLRIGRAGHVHRRNPARRSRISIRAASTAPWKTKSARLVLEDGSIWHGVGFGAKGTHIAEVVFNTSMTGYQEIMTDPSYKGQFVCFTHPHIGNVGVNDVDVESKHCHLRGIIVRDLSRTVSNYRSTSTLEDYCLDNDVVGISDLDTRALTRRIREKGSLVGEIYLSLVQKFQPLVPIGVISSDQTVEEEDLKLKARSWKIEGKDLLKEVTSDKPYEWTDPTLEEWDHNTRRPDHSPFHVVAYDYGIKYNIMRRLVSHGCKVTVVPAETTAEDVLEMNPDGIFFSNGPGDPSAAPYAVDNARKLLGKKPIFGICMGHQLLGQALGGKTFKLKFGHHGGNHPIRQNGTGRIEISAQNHNFAVDPDSLPDGVAVTHVNLNDGTCAGMVDKEQKVMTIQYHPESSPGPHDSDSAFADFVKMMNGEL